MKVLVTGATGFTGRALVPALLAAGWDVRATGRNAGNRPRCDSPSLKFIPADLATFNEWSALVEGMDAVVHLAARAHVMRDESADPLAAFRSANVVPTTRLAQAAARAGVGQFLFISSIKVNGEGKGDSPYSEADPPQPEDAYGVSKLEAERALRLQSADHGLSATILRPPLIYGPGVKGNFRRLLLLVKRGVPLPFAKAHNRRSLLFVGNFCSAVLAALKQPARGERVYLLSDGEDVSVAELIARIARALGRPARLFPFPVSALRAGASAFGLEGELRRLTGSLLVDSSRARNELQWSAPYSLNDGLAATAAWVLAEAAAQNASTVE